MWINYDGETRSLAEPSVMRNLLPKNILHLIEERRIPLRRLVLHLQRLPQLLQHPSLLARHLRRNHHANTNIQIAAPAVRIGQALAFLAKNLSGLRALRNLQLFIAFQSRHANLVAQRRLRKTNRNFADQIRPAPLEKVVLLHFQKNVKVAARSAVRSRFTLPRHSQTCPGIHARRNAHFQRAFALNAAQAAAAHASVLDRLPRSLARRASSRDGKKSLRVSHLPAPAARVAGSHPCARFRARALASLAQLVPHQLNFAGDARRSLFERKRHVVTQIRAALPPRRSATTPQPPAAQHFVKTKKIAENVLKFLEDRRVESGIESAIAQPCHSVAVVHRALLLVRKHCIRFGSGAKLMLGLFLLLRVAVRMPLQRRLAIRRFNLFWRRTAFDAQDFVKVSAVASCHRCYVSGKLKLKSCEHRSLDNKSLTVPRASVRGRGSHPHHRRTQHAAMKHITGLHLSHHSPFRLRSRRHILNRMMQIRIERLAHRFNRLQPLLRQSIPQLRANNFESLAVFRAGRARLPRKRQIKSIEHRKHLLDQQLRAAMPLLRAFSLHALAVILKVRLPPQQGVLQVLLFFDQFLNLFHSRSLARRQRLRRSLIRRGILRRASSRRKSALGKILVFVLFVCRQRNQPPSCSSEKNCAMNATAVI